jgi:predicted O-methyltransferase YrrM
VLWQEVARLHREDDTASRLLASAISAALNKSTSMEERKWINKIEALRNELNASSDEISMIDYGAGSPDLHLTADQMYQGRVLSTTIGKVCRTGSKQPPWAFLLFKLIREFKPLLCLELGTCLGISTAYLAAALELNQRGRITTLEGAESLASLAKKNFASLGLERVSVVIGRFQDKLPEVLRAQEHINFAFIDGHHDEHATLTYFEQILPHLAENAVVIFDDISWSEGMKRAWSKMVSHEKVQLSVDLQSMGICLVGCVQNDKKCYRIPLIE